MPHPPNPQLRPEFTNIGLFQPDIVREFKSQFQELRSQWPSLTPDDRLELLAGIVDHTLTLAHFPKVEVVNEDLPEGNNGVFNPSTFKMGISNSLLAKPTVTKDELIPIAEVMLHEMRHAEQAIRGSQGLARRETLTSQEANDLDDIATQIGINNQKTFRESIQAGEANPPNDIESDFGDTMSYRYEQDYLIYEFRILQEMGQSRDELLAARDTLQAAVNAGNTSQQELAQLQQDLDSKQNVWTEKHSAYKNLATEFDAFHASNLIKSLPSTPASSEQESSSPESSPPRPPMPKRARQSEPSPSGRQSPSPPKTRSGRTYGKRNPMTR